MEGKDRHDIWAAGDKYEPYVGRWSRRVAAVFLEWLAVPEGARWVDVGCGTGALTQTILANKAPRVVVGADRSEGFTRHAQATTRAQQAVFVVGDGQALPVDDTAMDAAVSGLVLNFVPAAEKMVREMARVIRPGGTCAVYVWDYADKMEFLRYFWDAAAMLDDEGASLDEGTRFPLCNPGPLRALFERSGLTDLDVRPIDIPTVFKDFDDYWTPFLGGQGSAPGYLMSLNADKRIALREALRETLPVEEDGSIRLVARAWAAKGTRP